MQNGDLIIELDADYNQALNNIVVSGNLLYHGEQNEAATLLSNFQNNVFTQGTVSLNESGLIAESFTIYPNPSKGKLSLKSKQNFQNITFKILDVTGREYKNGWIDNNLGDQIELEKAGLYLVQFFHESKLIKTQKVIIQ